jgi:hypothetical protein
LVAADWDEPRRHQGQTYLIIAHALTAAEREELRVIAHLSIDVRCCRMPEVERVIRRLVGSPVLYLTFETDGPVLRLMTLISRLHEIREVLEYLSGGQTSDSADTGQIEPPKGIDFEVLRVEFGSPFNIVLGILNAPRPGCV